MVQNGTLLRVKVRIIIRENRCKMGLFWQTGDFRSQSNWLYVLLPIFPIIKKKKGFTPLSR